MSKTIVDIDRERTAADWVAYDRRVRELESEGLTRSDAQGAVDLEDLRSAGSVE